MQLKDLVADYPLDPQTEEEAMKSYVGQNSVPVLVFLCASLFLLGLASLAFVPWWVIPMFGGIGCSIALVFEFRSLVKGARTAVDEWKLKNVEKWKSERKQPKSMDEPTCHD